MARKTKVEKKAPAPKADEQEKISVEQVCKDLGVGELAEINVPVTMLRMDKRSGYTDQAGHYHEFEVGDVVASFAGVKVKL